MNDLISRQAAITAIQKAYADTVGGTDRCAVWKNVGLTNALHIMQDLPSVQTEKMQLSKEDATKGTTFDCISRQAAIAVADSSDYVGLSVEDVKKVTDEVVKGLKRLPSVQPEPPEDICGECDAWNKYKSEIKALPSAQPESRREWYMKGYRDAQNAAMHESCTDCPLYDHDKHNCPRFNRVIPATIEEVKPMWIPVTERLPENNEEVLTTYIVNGNKNKRYTETATYYDDDEGDWLSPWDEYREAGARIEVIAWMSLPEPWKGGQDDR